MANYKKKRFRSHSDDSRRSKYREKLEGIQRQLDDLTKVVETLVHVQQKKNSVNKFPNMEIVDDTDNEAETFGKLSSARAFVSIRRLISKLSTRNLRVTVHTTLTGLIVIPFFNKKILVSHNTQ